MEPNFDSDDYYQVLGLKKDDDDDTIRKTYKKLAKKYHPDRNPDNKEACTKIFKQVTEAYEILSNPEKRQHYDQFGKIKEGGGPTIDPFDIFSQLFGGFNKGPFGGGNPFHQRAPPERRAKPTEHSVYLDVSQIYNGKQVKLNIERKHIFSPDGSPIDTSKYMNAVEKCGSCKGQGITTRLRQVGGGFISQETIHCSNCSGIGFMLKTGYKIKEVKEMVTIDVPKGTPFKTRFEIPQKGDMIPGYPVADVHIYVLEKPLPKYRREGNDLHVDFDIKLADALIGKELYFTHLDSRVIRLISNAIIVPDTIKKITGEGFQSTMRTGDLYLHFKIQFPQSLSKKQASLLHSILPLTPACSFTSTITLD